MCKKKEIITQLKEIALDAELGNLEKRTFLTEMNHKMRVPMNSIMGMLRLIQDTELTNNQKGYIKAAEDAAKYLLTLVEDFSSYSSVENGKSRIKDEPFKLHDACKEIISYHATEATSKKISLDYEFQIDHGDTLNGDIIKIQQILAKLLEYAILNSEKNQVLLRVSSERARIHSEEASKDDIKTQSVLFQVTFSNKNLQLRGSCDIFSLCESAPMENKKQKRLAIELAVCKKMAENMNGTLAMDNDNGSASFLFRIPLRETPLNEVEILSDEQDEKAGLHDGKLKMYAGVKVLVAEDDPINQSLAMAFLEKLGASVETADDGIETVEKFNSTKFDMIFMDCEMPELDGYRATQIIRDIENGKNLSRIPIIAMTAYAERGDGRPCAKTHHRRCSQ